MLNCCCSMAGSKACLTCPAYINELDLYVMKTYPKPPVAKIHRTIETMEYDKEGRCIKRIVEEEG